MAMRLVLHFTRGETETLNVLLMAILRSNPSLLPVQLAAPSSRTTCLLSIGAFSRALTTLQAS